MVCAEVMLSCATTATVRTVVAPWTTGKALVLTLSSIGTGPNEKVELAGAPLSSVGVVTMLVSVMEVAFETTVEVVPIAVHDGAVGLSLKCVTEPDAVAA